MNPINKQEEEKLALIETVKAIEEVKKDGFGQVVVHIQDNHIYRWEITKSRTKPKPEKGKVTSGLKTK